MSHGRSLNSILNESLSRVHQSTPLKRFPDAASDRGGADGRRKGGPRAVHPGKREVRLHRRRPIPSSADAFGGAASLAALLIVAFVLERTLEPARGGRAHDAARTDARPPWSLRTACPGHDALDEAA